MSYTLNWENKGLRIIVKGVFGDGFLEASLTATGDPRFSEVEYVIVDFLDVKDFPIGSRTLLRIALSNTEPYTANPNLKVAVLSNSLVMESLVHMYKMYFALNNSGKVWELKIFKNDKRARRWVVATPEDEWPAVALSSGEPEPKPNIGW